MTPIDQETPTGMAAAEKWPSLPTLTGLLALAPAKQTAKQANQVSYQGQQGPGGADPTLFCQ